MKAEILHIEECPSWEPVGRDLREVLDATGHDDVPLTYTLLESSEQAAEVPFAGSPTILVDGIDLFPTAPHTTDLACRVYLTPGGLRPRPTREQIEQALAERTRG